VELRIRTGLAELGSISPCWQSPATLSAAAWRALARAWAVSLSVGGERERNELAANDLERMGLRSELARREGFELQRGELERGEFVRRSRGHATSIHVWGWSENGMCRVLL
jgi:hypothetical protein